MSETLVQRPTPVDLRSVHRQTQTPTREVIDVDDLYDDDIEEMLRNNHATGASARGHTQGNTAPDIIVVDDIDEDIQVLGGPSRTIAANAGNIDPRDLRNRRRHISRRVLFSPPPRPQDNAIPPVPPIPLPFREPPPLRYRPPPDFAAGVFRPIDRPFPFENEIDGHANRRNREGHPEVLGNAEARGRERRRNMGLGGAVLMLNRQRQLEEENARRRQDREANPWMNLGVNTLGLLRRVFGFGDHDNPPGALQDEDHDFLEALAMSRAEHAGLEYAPLINRLGTGADRLRRNAPVEYRQVYTHPLKPEPGFSNDFSSPDAISVGKPGPSSVPSTEAGTILVCAKCLDPLVMNVTGSEDMVRKRRLWALRCGHMLDGKCIDELMKPRPVADNTAELDNQSGPTTSQSAEGEEKETVTALEDAVGQTVSLRRDKGKRKARALEDDNEYIPSDRKGKVRARVVQQAESPFASEQVAGSVSSLPSEHSIRSRLRPRKAPAQTSESLTSARTSDDPTAEQSQGDEEMASPEPQSRVIRGRRRGAARGRGRIARPAKRKGKGKGKEKAKAPVIEAEFEWLCPVASCQHKHWSVLIDGVWKVDDERELGAVALYV